MTTSAFRVRFSLAYAFLMIGNGVLLPFLPLWLQSQGLSLAENSEVIAAMTIVRVVGAPFFAAFADYTGNRLLVIRLCAGASFLAFAALSISGSFQPILAIGAFAAFLFSPVFPLTEGFSVEAASRVGLDYGRIRQWASLSFLLGSLGSGALLIVVPIQYAMVLIAGAQLISALATWILPPEPPHPSHLPQVSPVQLRDAFKFLFASRFTVFLLAASLANCSHGMLYTEGAVYWVQLGFSTFDIGLLWASAVLAEATLFFLSVHILKRVPLARLLCIGLFGATLRWLAMGFATGFWPILLLQLLHCISFATTHLSLMHFIRLNVPQNLRNSAQGLYTAFASGLLLSGAQWFSGPLFEWAGGKAFLAMAAIAGIGLVVALFNLWKLSPTAQVAVVASPR
ncbi:MAG: MFS transporter [Pseudomonadota bacterium]|nr:MFS transporter [Pseudomonadota bacterium]